MNIKDLNDKISKIISEVEEVEVVGRVRNMRESDNGWYNFKITNDAQFVDGLECRARARSVNKPIDGEIIVATGKLQLYRARGSVQLLVSKFKISEDQETSLE